MARTIQLFGLPLLPDAALPKLRVSSSPFVVNTVKALISRVKLTRFAILSIRHVAGADADDEDEEEEEEDNNLLAAVGSKNFTINGFSSVTSPSYTSSTPAPGTSGDGRVG